MTEEEAERKPATKKGGASPRLWVIGCGNPLAGDDGAGIEIARRLEGLGLEWCQVRSLTAGRWELLESIPPADSVVFVDAVSSGAPPGTLHLVPLPSSELEPRGLAALSTHGWGFIQTLEVARATGQPGPRCLLLGIEVGAVAPGAARSQAVEEAIALVVERFPRLQRWLTESESALWRSSQRFPPGKFIAPEST